MPFSLSVPNFSAALPEPRVQAPQSNSGVAIGQGILDGTSAVAEGFLEASQAKQAAKALGDALGDTPEGRQFSALADVISPNLLAKDGGKSGSAITKGLLADASAIIKQGAATRGRSSLAQTQADLIGNQKKLDFGYKSDLQSQETLGALTVEQERQANAETLREIDQQNELTLIKRKAEEQRELEAYRNDLVTGLNEKDDKESFNKDVVRALYEGRFSTSDAVEISGLVNSGASREAIIARIGTSDILAPLGTRDGDGPSAELLGGEAPSGNQTAAEALDAAGSSTGTGAARALLNKLK